MARELLPDVEQISLSLSVERNALSPASAASTTRQQREAEVIRRICVDEFGQEPAFNIHKRLAPFHVCLSQSFAAHVRDIHQLLDRALIDIVERWFTDENANFPARMPIERHEEDLLRWIDGPGSAIVPPFREKYGMWRTDYLVEGELKGKNAIKICEINARIPFNGIWLIGSHGEAYKKHICPDGLGSFSIPDEFEKTKKAIHANFSPNLPLHLIRAQWPGVDSHGFLHSFRTTTGQPAHHATPLSLRLQPDTHAPGGYRLLHSPPDGGEPHDVHQCAVELFQEELEGLDEVLLRKLATCCTNDFRNVLLVHDKRLLGILHEELDDVVARGVFTKDEAARLRHGIAETLLPGSPQLQDLLDRSRLDAKDRQKWIVKPARDAIGHGIVLGADMEQNAWLALLEEQSARYLRPGEGAVVVQRLAEHMWYPIVRHADAIPAAETANGDAVANGDAAETGNGNGNGVGHGDAVANGEVDGKGDELFHLIGSHHVVNSRYDMFGPWRIGRKVHAGVAETGSGIVMSAVVRSDDVRRGTDEKEEE